MNQFRENEIENLHEPPRVFCPAANEEPLQHVRGNLALLSLLQETASRNRLHLHTDSEQGGKFGPTLYQSAGLMANAAHAIFEDPGSPL
jgi:hypothetical protein